MSFGDSIYNKLMRMKKIQLVDLYIDENKHFKQEKQKAGVIALHNSQLQEKIKTLEMENEWGKTATLKWNDELNKNQKLMEDNEKLMKHNLKLMDDNEKLKAVIKTLEEDIKIQMECENLNLDLQKKMNEENEKLEEENEKLKEDFTKYTGQDVSPEILKKYDELRDEYDDLKGALAGMTADRDEKEEENDKLITKIDKLKDENEELKEELDTSQKDAIQMLVYYEWTKDYLTKFQQNFTKKILDKHPEVKDAVLQAFAEIIKEEGFDLEKLKEEIAPC